MSGAVRGGMRAALSALGARGSVGLAVCTVGRPAPLAVVGGGLGASSLGASQARAFAGIISRGGGVPRGTGLLPLAAAASRSPTGVAAVDSGVPSGHGAAATHFALHTLRGFSGSSSNASSSILNDVLGSANAVVLRDTLEDRSSQDSHISYGELVDIIKDCTGSKTDAEAAKVCQTLCDAGVILKFGDMVYLKPMEVTRTVLKALPGVPSEVYGVDKEDLNRMKEELVELEAGVERARQSAQFQSRIIVGTGLLFLLGQLSLFIRLTYVELSWDVMEPVSYFVGLGNAIMVYIYFMYTNRDFSFFDWSNSMERHYSKQKIKQAGIDWERYKSLARRIKRM